MSAGEVLTTKPPDKEKRDLHNALCQISENIQRIVQQAKTDIENGVDDFVSKHIGKLFAIVGVYKTAFETMQVATKGEFEKKASQYYRDTEIRDQLEEVLENEEEWNGLLHEVDTSLTATSEVPMQEGERGPLSVPVVDARTGSSRKLESYIPSQSYLILILLRHFA